MRLHISFGSFLLRISKDAIRTSKVYLFLGSEKWKMLNHAFVLYVLTTTFRIANCNLLFPVWILYLKILLRIFKYFLVRIYYEVLWKYDFGTFWRTIIHRRIVLKQFPLSMLILGQKSCILGPTILKIPQPNWH